MKTRHCAHPLLALGATRPWTKYWLVSEQEWGSQRDTHLAPLVTTARRPAPGSLLTCACGRAVETV